MGFGEGGNKSGFWRWPGFGDLRIYHIIRGRTAENISGYNWNVGQRSIWYKNYQIHTLVAVSF